MNCRGYASFPRVICKYQLFPCIFLLNCYFFTAILVLVLICCVYLVNICFLSHIFSIYREKKNILSLSRCVPCVYLLFIDLFKFVNRFLVFLPRYWMKSRQFILFETSTVIVLASKFCLVCGWFTLSFQKLSSSLRKLWTTLLGNQQCSEFDQRITSYDIPSIKAGFFKVRKMSWLHF